MDSHEATSPASVNLASPVACLNCRGRHLKCDGNLSGCARCASLSLPCHFVPSRRGRKCRPGPYRTTTPSFPLLEDSVSLAAEQPTIGMSPFSPLNSMSQQRQHPAAYLTYPPSSASRDRRIHLISLYYLRFYNQGPQRTSLMSSSSSVCITSPGSFQTAAVRFKHPCRRPSPASKRCKPFCY
jgi:hypothetical protein